MWRWLVILAVIAAVAAIGISMVDSSGGDQVTASAVLGAVDDSSAGFARATEPLAWEFPLDFGAHPEYQTEWWYYTGNLTDEGGRRFGFQFTIFRRAIVPPSTAANEPGEWRADQLYMAHFAVTDVQGNRFYHDERFSRGGAGLAGAEADPRYRIWLEDWQVIAVDDAAQQTRITAQMRADDDRVVAIDFTLDQLKPPALQGDAGLSQKSGEAGNASHYYTLSRLATSGTITIADQTFTVTGFAWKDHEFGTSALGGNALGWDWFGLQFDDNRELMIGQIRLVDGGREPNFGGLLINADGSTVYLPASSFTIEPTATWESPHTGAVYPAGWNITVSGAAIGAERDLVFTAAPLIADQELHGGGIAYYEGAVRLEGDVTGFGYAELTGYTDAMTGRF